MLWAAIAILFVLMWILSLVDALRRSDLTTSAKVVWSLAIVFIPVIGVVAYWVARPSEPIHELQPGDVAPAEDQIQTRHPF
jgi:hypothetical protein